MGKNGGRRPGAGRKKGGHTIAAEAARAHMVARVVRELDPLIDSHLALAKGLMRLFRIDEEKNAKGQMVRKHVLVTDPEEMRKALDSLEPGGKSGDGYYYLSAKEPDSRSLEYLTSQVVGKPKESVELSGKDGAPIEHSVSNAIERVYKR